MSFFLRHVRVLNVTRAFFLIRRYMPRCRVACTRLKRNRKRQDRKVSSQKTLEKYNRSADTEKRRKDETQAERPLDRQTDCKKKQKIARQIEYKSYEHRQTDRQIQQTHTDTYTDIDREKAKQTVRFTRHSQTHTQAQTNRQIALWRGEE